MLPDPSLLDSKSWGEGVLPNMGPRLGIFQYGSQIYPSNRHDLELDSNFYPKQPLLNLEQWQNIIDYYTATSPDSLAAQDRKQSIQSTLPFFSVQDTSIQLSWSNNFFCKNKWGLLTSFDHKRRIKAQRLFPQQAIRNQRFSSLRTSRGYRFYPGQNACM